MTQTADRNISRSSALGLTLVTALALLGHELGLSGWPQGALAIVVVTFLPGAAILALLPPLNLAARIGLAAAFSIAVLAACSYVLILLKIFYPQIAIWTLYPLSCALLLWRAQPSAGGASLADRLRERLAGAGELLARDRAATAGLAISAVALLLWVAGVFSTEFTNLDNLGLINVLPLTWKLGFAAALLAAAAYATARNPSWWVLSILVAVPIAMFYLTPVIVYTVPHLPWTFKHIGVTEMLLQLHHARPNLDIYNRWPSFFAAAGVYTRLGNFDDPVQYVKWAEIYFVAIQAVLVAGIALANDVRRGVAAVCVMLFVAINWVGQAYFSPQATGFTLMLAVLLIYWQFLYAGGNRLARLLERIAGFIVRRKQEWSRERAGHWPRPLAAALALLPMAGIVLVHQLTPFVLLVQIGTLWLLGYVRPYWMFWGAAAITAAYLLPQLSWVNEHFGLFSSLNPLDNAKNQQTEAFSCDPNCMFVQSTARIATLLAWLGGCAAILVLGRRQPQARIAALAVCFFAAFVMLFGQSYGGEAALRVVLFGSPFTALLIAMAVFAFRSQRLRRVAAMLAVLLFGSGLYVSYFGLEGVSYLRPADLQAANYLNAHAPKGSVFIPFSPKNVNHQTANYGDFSDIDTLASLISYKYKHRPYSPAALRDVLVLFSRYTVPIYLTVSPRGEEFNVRTGQFQPGFQQKMRRAMLASGRFTLFQRVGDVEILEYLPRRPGAETRSAQDGRAGIRQRRLAARQRQRQRARNR
jgi:hypothetical protein